MQLIREVLEKLKSTITPDRQLSGFMCESCEFRNHCSLPAHRRQLCWEARALRSR